nr:MAG TPA: hypothetical protein [Caudoviricetes sp.]
MLVTIPSQLTVNLLPTLIGKSSSALLKIKDFSNLVLYPCKSKSYPTNLLF